MPHRITQCYLPPCRADIPTLTPAEAGTQLRDPGGMQGWVDLVGWLHTEMYTRPKTVTHPGTNRARRALTSFLRRTPLTITPSSVVGAWNSYWAVAVLMQGGLRRRRRMDNAWCSFPSVSLAISLSLLNWAMSSSLVDYWVLASALDWTTAAAEMPETWRATTYVYENSWKVMESELGADFHFVAQFGLCCVLRVASAIHLCSSVNKSFCI